MKITINGQAIGGKTEDLAVLLKSFGDYDPIERSTPGPEPAMNDVVPFDSPQSLKEMIAADPNYNPYPGVSTPKADTPIDTMPIALPPNSFTAEQDTGVQIGD